MLTEILSNMAKVPALVEQNTVFNKRIINSGRRYEYEYWGKEKDLVDKALDEAVSRIETKRSPHRSPLHMEGEFWVGYLEYWGLD